MLVRLPAMKITEVATHTPANWLKARQAAAKAKKASINAVITPAIITATPRARQKDHTPLGTALTFSPTPNHDLLPKKELLAPVAAGHAMIHRARILQPQLSCHAQPARPEPDLPIRKFIN